MQLLVKEAATRYGLTEGRIKSWIWNGWLPSKRVPTPVIVQRIYVDSEAIEQLLKEREGEPA